GVAPAARTRLAGLHLTRAPRLARAGGVRVADVDTASKANPAVDHQDLAVVAVVDVPVAGSLRRIDRIELAQVRAAVAQLVEILPRRADRADAVVEDIDLYALRDLLADDLRQLLANLAALEDVGLEIDVIARGIHRREHRAMGARAVDQDL